MKKCFLMSLVLIVLILPTLLAADTMDLRIRTTKVYAETQFCSELGCGTVRAEDNGRVTFTVVKYTPNGNITYTGGAWDATVTHDGVSTFTVNAIGFDGSICMTTNSTVLCMPLLFPTIQLQWTQTRPLEVTRGLEDTHRSFETSVATTQRHYAEVQATATGTFLGSPINPYNTVIGLERRDDMVNTKTNKIFRNNALTQDELNAMLDQPLTP